MAEAEVEQGDAPEFESVRDKRRRVKKKLQEAVLCALDKNATQFASSLMENGGKIPAANAKMLIDVAFGSEDEDEHDGVGEGFPSLAEVLWKELEELGTADEN